QLLDDLKNPDGYTAPTIKTIYNNAPPLPPHFIPRPDEYNKLKNALLSDTSDRQVALTALQGLGGIGKSVMANAVCKDDFLAGAFPDGVFWLELGREPGEIV
ncbi:MAG TPA: NB-ARC domain-containing protein, partial [Aggregatilineales bacterium]|nr:NB-ARC domain-containing protein [Aggregatilineales bacterium]